MPTTDPCFTAMLERIAIWLNRADLALLRARYRGRGGYSTHIRKAVAELCWMLRADLRRTEDGRQLLRSLNQENL